MSGSARWDPAETITYLGELPLKLMGGRPYFVKRAALVDYFQLPRLRTEAIADSNLTIGLPARFQRGPPF